MDADNELVVHSGGRPANDGLREHWPRSEDEDAFVAHPVSASRHSAGLVGDGAACVAFALRNALAYGRRAGGWPACGARAWDSSHGFTCKA